MPATSCGLFIDPQGRTVDVSITTSAGGAATLYTAENGSTAFTFPTTISSVTGFYAASPGALTVSVTLNGQEIAGPSGAAQPVALSSGSFVRVNAVTDLAELTTASLRRSQFATPYVPVASRTAWCQLTSGGSTANVSNGTDLGNSYRLNHTCIQAASPLVLVYHNGLIQAGNESDGRNDIVVQASIETVGNTTFLPVSFDGKRSVTIQPGQYAYSDPVGATFSKGDTFWTRTYVTGSGASFADGVSNTTTTYTSATAAFTQADVGRAISGTDIPLGTFVSVVGSATSITLSAAATGSHSGNTFILGRPSTPTAEGPSGLLWTLNHSSSTSTTLLEGAATNTNKVVAGSFTLTSGLAMYGPAAILGVPYLRGQSVIGIIGDSIISGFGENRASSPVASPQPTPGWFLRALNNNYAFVQLSTGGDAANTWNLGQSKRSRRLALAGYCTHLIVALGTNVPSTAQADLVTLYATLAKFGLPIWACTIPPNTTSTDSWATTANQTVTANEAARVATNAFIRALPANVTGYFEVADQVETARDSGKWQSVGSGLGAAITTDGVHPNTAGHTQIAAATALNAAALASAFGAVSV